MREKLFLFSFFSSFKLSSFLLEFRILHSSMLSPFFLLMHTVDLTTYSYKFSSVVELLRVFYRLMKVYALKKTQIALNGFKHTSISKVLERYMNGCRQRLVK